MHKKIFIFLSLIVIGFLAYSQDITPPAPVSIRYVSVNPSSGNVTISWNPSSSVDVDVYSVYKLIDTYKIHIGDVTHPTTSFTNTTLPSNTTSSLANDKIETYYVSAIDDAPPPGPNESELSPPHSTIHLQSIFRPCYSEIRLSWNSYDAWLSGVHSYEVYCKIDNGPWLLLDVLGNDMNSFVHHELEADKDYYYYVQANDGSGAFSSSSNRVTEYTLMDHAPTILRANYASVISENNIELEFTVDLTADVSRYKIIRTDSIGADFDTIASFEASSLLNDEILYTDYASTEKIHYYKMMAFNKTCDVPFAKRSNFASNIILNAVALNNLKNDLIWNNYFDWEMGISYFEVERTVDGSDPTIVAEIPYGDTTFFDKIDNYLYDPTYNPLDPLDEVNKSEYLDQPIVSGRVCYRVRALEGQGAVLGTYSSWSNSFCVIQEPIVFIPNAFTPNFDGVNDLFYPYVSFSGLNKYEFIIFDRWGQLVYQTDNAHEPWDGYQVSGDKMAPPGTYVYFLKFIDGNEKSHMYKGDVILMR